jgi:anti-anti-sigma factor
MLDKTIKLEVEPIENHPDARLLRLDGDLDSMNVETTLTLVNKLFAEGMVHLVADFTNLRYINSTGLGILLHVSKSARAKGGSFKVACVNENVYEVIEVIGANALLDIYPQLDEAIKSLP